MTVHFIWDFDGTLVESSQAIREVLALLYQTYHLPFDEDWVMTFIVQESIGALLQQLAREEELSFEELLTFFNQEQEARDHMINVMPGAKEVLEKTAQKGVKHYILTHKGATTHSVLERLDMTSYFEEVVTAADGFKRKPDPEALTYLINKYQMDKKRTYYIGDRPLDQQAAEKAGIQSLNLTCPSSSNNQHINDLMAILDLLPEIPD
ncbi:HAD-IA family hydrolase [Streptococcus dysgalactiae]|uniref:HAD family hydrolase n=1 Tax=Streptococcus dysgalactiae subsp. dysgalactiae TaxID=99822 RepID=A0A9X7SHW4_STRDY|nr:HAD-IA family hydrolase [Streptococcus dysgalactiae]MSU86912.1 HAD family hydrolase [Streptococcus dysgalactiae subsp. dysgalactiae]QGG98651.1 HAD family hydrolase [Streptococcus dysgalactiae subsp. dysgalactiae]QGH02361.1 HAD family hydrolase [Streptococcus dysgalactiae subsp. dysgalactiae]